MKRILTTRPKSCECSPRLDINQDIQIWVNKVKRRLQIIENCENDSFGRLYSEIKIKYCPICGARLD